MKRAKWGILGTSAIFAGRVMTGIRGCKHVELAAIASRDLDRAQDMARQFDIPHAYGTYEELLADPSVEAVYNPLPNHLHLPWSIKVLEAGKHLLCEKPLGLNAPQATELFVLSKKRPELKVMEAFMFRLHPQWVKVKNIIKEGGIGNLRFMQENFSFTTLNPKDIRNNPECGGGALMDIGCYCISLARYLFEDEPVRVSASMERDKTFGVDWITTGTLLFPGGRCSFTCSIQLPGYQRVQILGTEGRIEIEFPFGGPPEVPWKIWHFRAGKSEEISMEICNPYTLQFDHFSLAVLNNSAVFTPLADAVSNMKVIDAVVQSAENDVWVTP